MMIKILTKNKKAFFDYEILETWEAGIELLWHEVKSVRAWHLNLKWSYVSLLSGVPYIKWMHITPWSTLPNREKIAGMRERKVFLHKKTVSLLFGKQKEGGYAIIPLEVYLKDALIKVKIWLGKWRKEYNKKQLLKERTLDKEAKMNLKKFI